MARCLQGCLDSDALAVSAAAWGAARGDNDVFPMTIQHLLRGDGCPEQEVDIAPSNFAHKVVHQKRESLTSGDSRGVCDLAAEGRGGFCEGHLMTGTVCRNGCLQPGWASSDNEYPSGRLLGEDLPCLVPFGFGADLRIDDAGDGQTLFDAGDAALVACETGSNFV